MKSLDIPNEQVSFIRGWYIDPLICDNLIDFFKTDTYFPIGKGKIGVEKNLNTDVKDSFDKSVSAVTCEPRLSTYFNALSSVVDLYKEEFEFCNKTQQWGIVEHVNIQYYAPGGGYKIFHTERNGELTSISRHLVFMTYLNDVTDNGETEFYYQKLKVKPEKGLTLIWPSDWTYTHRGIVSQTQEKIIITGWYSFR